MPLPAPLNLQAWIDEHRHLLKPPVGNKCIHDGDFIVMVVGGPNQRTDYHWDEGPEWFHQLEGEMVLRIQEDGAVRDIPIRAGETFLLPPRTPLELVEDPGETIRRLDPSALIWLFTWSWAPWPSPTVRITDEIPITMPSIVKMERSRCALMASPPARKVSSQFIPGHLPPRPAHRW